MRIDYLANWCESMIVSFLPTLSKNRKKGWQEECGLELCSHFEEISITPEYKFYETNNAFILLKTLYKLLKAWKLDSQWIEIQKVSQETEESLRLFILQLRETENEIVVTQDILSGYVGAHLKSFAITSPCSIDHFSSMFEEFNKDLAYTKLHLSKDILELPQAASITEFHNQFEEIIKEETLAIRPNRYAPITRWPELQMFALKIVSNVKMDYLNELT